VSYDHALENKGLSELLKSHTASYLQVAHVWPQGGFQHTRELKHLSFAIAGESAHNDSMFFSRFGQATNTNVAITNRFHLLLRQDS
jgi:hypothetical protein